MRVPDAEQLLTRGRRVAAMELTDPRRPDAVGSRHRARRARAAARVGPGSRVRAPPEAELADFFVYRGPRSGRPGSPTKVTVGAGWPGSPASATVVRSLEPVARRSVRHERDKSGGLSAPTQPAGPLGGERDRDDAANVNPRPARASIPAGRPRATTDNANSTASTTSGGRPRGRLANRADASGGASSPTSLRDYGVADIEVRCRRGGRGGCTPAWRSRARPGRRRHVVRRDGTWSRGDRCTAGQQPL